MHLGRVSCIPSGVTTGFMTTVDHGHDALLQGGETNIRKEYVVTINRIRQYHEPWFSSSTRSHFITSY